MPSRSGLRRRGLAALAILTVAVAASVGKCEMPQPKFPTLGVVASAPATTAAQATSAASRVGTGAISARPIPQGRPPQGR